MFDFKNASKEERQKEYTRLAKEIGDDQFFTKKELNHLPEILADGEQVLAFSSGLMDNKTWLITLTDRRIIFLDKGMIFGLKQVSINLDKINAVSGTTGLMFGKILIQDGATERQISNVWKKTVVNFTNKVRDAIQALKQPVPSSRQSAHTDVISMLERLAALKENGTITEEEFEKQKSKLLNS